MPARVSVITPSFNRQEFIAETLDSLLLQTFSDWENIIVDDGSTDNTMNIINDYIELDSRISLYNRNSKLKPKGACACRNQGVDIAEGEYLVFLDTDDLLEPFCLEQRISIMDKNPELDFSIFPSMVFKEYPHDLKLWWNIDKNKDDLTRQFHQDGLSQGTGVIWRRTSFNRIGQWDENLHIWQDVDLFYRAYIQNYRYKKCFTLPADLHNRRLEGSLSHGNFFSKKKTESRIQVLKKAVVLLKKNNKEVYLHEAIYMAAGIISALSRTGNFCRANELVNWAFGEGVVNRYDLILLRVMINLRRMRLYKVPIISTIIQQIENQFSVEGSTLGVLTYVTPLSTFHIKGKS